MRRGLWGKGCKEGTGEKEVGRGLWGKGCEEGTVGKGMQGGDCGERDAGRG